MLVRKWTFKKNPDEKYFLIMEKIEFEKFSVTDFENSFRRSDISFVNGKSHGNFFKLNFLHDEKMFFVRIFFKPQELDLSYPTQPTRGSGDLSPRNNTDLIS